MIMSSRRISSTYPPYRTGLTIWAMGWAIMLGLGHSLSLASICTIAVITSALGALTLNFIASVVLATVSTLAINWLFVPPQGSFIVDLSAHAALLTAQWCVSISVPALIAIQRRYSLWLSDKLLRTAEIDTALTRLLKSGDHLSVHTLCEFFGALTSEPFSLMLVDNDDDNIASSPVHRHIGNPSFNDKAVMWIVLRQGLPFGPLTGNNESLDCWFLPLRQRGKLQGVVHLPLQDPEHDVLLKKKYAAVMHALLYFDKHGKIELN
jgi:two-component system sensor histidine kinase KdpD